MPKPTRKPTAEKPPFIGVLPGRDLHRAMLRLQARDGITMSEQTRRALAEWLKKQGVLTPKKEQR
jgi:hypothetical protein